MISMDKYQEKLLASINQMILNHIDNLSYDRTIIGKIININEDIYTIQWKNEEFLCRAREGLILNVNDLVFIKIPLNNMNNKYIIDKKPLNIS